MVQPWRCIVSDDFFFNYANKIAEYSNLINHIYVDRAYTVLLDAYLNKIPVYVIGNGGSASLSQHFSCDHTKGVCHDTEIKSNVISLASNIALMTAIANDYSYDEVFSKQIEYENNIGSQHLLVAISASGNSPNIIKALETAGSFDWSTISFVGFDGGRILKDNLSNITIHVPVNNYGMVEDIHQMLMHSISQRIRSQHNVLGNLKL